MKNKICLFVAIIIMAQSSYAQYSHFENRSIPYYTADNFWQTTSGTRVDLPTTAVLGLINPGIIPAGGNNLYILEAPLPLGFTGLTGYGYIANIPGSGCSATSQMVQTSGISVLGVKPTTQTMPAKCVVAGACQTGVFFAWANLGSSPGNMISPTYYEFLAPANSLPSQPHIMQSATASGFEFYICGEYNNDMYIIKVDGSGNIMWSLYYSISSLGFNNELIPSSIIEDPYMPSALCVVGQARFQPGGSDGFFLKIDEGGGGVINFTTYGQPLSVDDKFNSISVSSSPAGYVIGGATKISPSSATPWALKLDASGNIIWNKTILSSYDPNALGILSIKERINPISSALEYYALFDSNQKTTVGKLDITGDPFDIANPGKMSEFPFNQWYYNPSKPVDLYIDNGPVSGSTTGFNIYGTVYAGSFNWANLISSFFNGESTCNTPVNLPQVQTPNVVVTQHGPPQQYAAFSACTAISIVQSVYVCYGGGNTCVNIYNTTGNNLRTAAPVIQTNQGEKPEDMKFNAYPNPTNDQINISFDAEKGARVKLDLYDMLGQHIKTINEMDVEESGEQKSDFSLNKLQLPQGMYLLILKVGSKEMKQKIMYAK